MQQYAQYSDRRRGVDANRPGDDAELAFDRRKTAGHDCELMVDRSQPILVIGQLLGSIARLIIGAPALISAS